ncbi:unnamed protein product [Schistocephalus solidus]|uniref:Transcription elongation factor n=1 Tax=Schistocephalus solidus TaxID=70667 RepID=A0A183T0S2_SCHSO|nr:unnamed protein product [Schistocephalus solidus]
MEVTEKIVRKLDKMMKRNSIDNELTLKYLHRLQETDMTLDILTKTGIGIIINKIRKETDCSEVTSLGKQLIKEWKKLVPEKVDGTAPSAGSKRSPDHTNGTSGDDGGPTERKLARRLDDSEMHQSQDVPEAGGRAFFMSKSLDTDDGIRLKAREMIQSALESSPIPSGAFEAEYLAIRIETEIFNLFKSTDPKYKQRVRTRVMNLRDSNNPSLRINVLMGHVKPERLASMTSEEMASKDMKDLREKYTKETIDDHQMAVTGGTESDILKCGKCKQNKCTYNQVQTRSADEPMTTFVYCNSCGHRWKVRIRDLRD